MSTTTEKPWKPTHATKARFAANAPYAKSGQLAATAIEAAGLHRDGRMNAAQYAQRIQGIEREASEAGIEKEYREALRIQLEQLAAEPEKSEPPPAAAEKKHEEPTAYEQLEALYRQHTEEYLAALKRKDAMAAAEAELDLHNVAFALECERFGWVSK